MNPDYPPKVSIVIPVYNGARYMRAAIDSALAQTYQNIEVLVVNDGSDDGGQTDSIARSYGQRLRYFPQENGGVASALNRGIREMKGRYFAWLSHDDAFLPEKIASQVDFLNKNKAFAACYSDYFRIDAAGAITGKVAMPWLPREKALKALFGRQYINGSTMVIKRECFDQVGMFDEHLRYTQDMEMWFRLLQRFEIGRVPQALAEQRVHPEQGSRETKPFQKEAQLIFDRLFANIYGKDLPAAAPLSAGSAKEWARLHTWYGLILSRNRGWIAMGSEELKKALACWPSWQNPARLHLLINRVLPALHAWRQLRVRVVCWLMKKIRALTKKT
jgi:glycosyltransferase involved in cell wall biosynthesis